MMEWAGKEFQTPGKLGKVPQAISLSVVCFESLFLTAFQALVLLEISKGEGSEELRLFR